MTVLRFPKNEFDLLLLNAQLRDELEPFMDESVELVDASQMSTEEENNFLQAMLCWERSPVIPISQWFEPELQLPHPDTLSDRNLSKVMWDAVERLAESIFTFNALTIFLTGNSIACYSVTSFLRPKRN